MAISGIMTVKFQQGLTQKIDESSKEANMLAGDAIVNYRTVASFGQEEKIVQKYKELLGSNINAALRQHHYGAIAYGFGQFVQYLVFAGLFWAGQLIQDNNPDVNALDVFIAIFAMMFGATAAG